MKLPNIDSARIVRDSGMDAMDAVNEILVDLTGKVSAEEMKVIRRGIALVMDAVCVNLVNPVLRQYPELDVDVEVYGRIALERARLRSSRTTAGENP